MVKSGGLIQGIAVALGIPSTKVTFAARMVRERRLLTSGAHGVNAPHMTFLDASRLLTGFLVTEKPTVIVDAIRVFGALMLDYAPDIYPSEDGHIYLDVAGREVRISDGTFIPSLDFLDELHPQHRFEEGLAALIESASNAETHEFYGQVGLEVACSPHRGEATIIIPGRDPYVYRFNRATMALGKIIPDPEYIERFKDDSARDVSATVLLEEFFGVEAPRIQVQRSVDAGVICSIASLFSGEA